MTVADPTLKVERAIQREGVDFVIGMDEVGRGAIAGPVAVGVCMIGRRGKRMPVGLRDSKMLSERRREQLEPLARAFGLFSAVGLATNDEVDDIGLTRALGLAGARAIEGLIELGAPVADAVVLLDGSWDYVNPALSTKVALRTRVKADRDCGTVAAASVIAKVHRDRMMIAAHDAAPVYGWVGNKGYASSAHYAAIHAHGAHDLHRVTWLHQAPPVLDGFEELEAVPQPAGEMSAGSEPRPDRGQPGGAADVDWARHG